LVRTVEATTCVAVSGPLINSAKVFELVAPLESVAVTMKLVGAAPAAAVPVIAPVAVLIESADGNAGEIEKVTDGVPPDDVTGVKLAAAPAVIVSADLTSVVVSAVAMVSANVFALVAPVASVAVTV
jgi:hypothetical protein